MNRRVSYPSAPNSFDFPSRPTCQSYYPGCELHFRRVSTPSVFIGICWWARFCRVGQHSRRMRRGGRSFEASGIRFRCWLERSATTFIICLSSGMAIGFFRSSGQRSYLVWWAAVFRLQLPGFLTIGLQRHQLTADVPTIPWIWQTQADSRPSNPLLYLGRILSSSYGLFLALALLFSPCSYH